VKDLSFAGNSLEFCILLSGFWDEIVLYIFKKNCDINELFILRQTVGLDGASGDVTHHSDKEYCYINNTESLSIPFSITAISNLQFFEEA
jgi:hypothetical protein